MGVGKHCRSEALFYLGLTRDAAYCLLDLPTICFEAPESSQVRALMIDPITQSAGTCKLPYSQLLPTDPPASGPYGRKISRELVRTKQELACRQGVHSVCSKKKPPRPQPEGEHARTRRKSQFAQDRRYLIAESMMSGLSLKRAMPVLQPVHNSPRTHAPHDPLLSQHEWSWSTSNTLLAPGSSVPQIAHRPFWAERRELY